MEVIRFRLITENDNEHFVFVYLFLSHKKTGVVQGITVEYITFVYENNNTKSINKREFNFNMQKIKDYFTKYKNQFKLGSINDKFLYIKCTTFEQFKRNLQHTLLCINSFLRKKEKVQKQ